MSTEETRRLAQNYLDVLTRVLSTGDLDLLDGIASAGFIEHGGAPDGGDGIGVASWKLNAARSRSTFPDSQLIPRAILADGDQVAIHAALRGTHLGNGMGMPPTGKEVALEYVDIVRFQDGKAVERWIIADRMVLLAQLGLAEEPGA
jgi:predicted ester cyclase